MARKKSLSRRYIILRGRVPRRVYEGRIGKTGRGLYGRKRALYYISPKSHRKIYITNKRRETKVVKGYGHGPNLKWKPHEKYGGWTKLATKLQVRRYRGRHYLDPRPKAVHQVVPVAPVQPQIDIPLPALPRRKKRKGEIQNLTDALSPGIAGKHYYGKKKRK